MYKQKIYTITLASLLLAWLSACSDNSSDPAESATQDQQPDAVVYDFTPVDINPMSEVSLKIITPRMSTNMLPGTMRHIDNFLTDGILRMMIRGSGRRPSKTLRVHGYYEPPGTMIVQVDVSQLALQIEAAIGRDQNIALVDEDGWTFSPFGYWLREGVEVEIGLDSRNYFRTLKELPPLPSSGENQLKLLFKPTLNAHIIGMTVGNTLVGKADFWVVPRN
jgi:hypothetical protein